MSKRPGTVWDLAVDGERVGRCRCASALLQERDPAYLTIFLMMAVAVETRPKAALVLTHFEHR